MGGAAAPGSAAAFRMITAAPCRELSLVCFVDFGLPGGATARPRGAGCLLAAMPLRDSSCPAGASPPYGWGVHLAGEIAFSFVGKRDVFTLQLVFCLPGKGCLSACPAGAKTTFSFAGQKKKRFWTPKKKRWTGGNDHGRRYNRTLVLCCYGVPRVKSFGVSLLFPAACV